MNAAAKTDEGSDEEELPSAVVTEAERLTRQAREAVDENEREAYLRARDDLLEPHGFRARIRDDERAVLVLYPDEWVEDGTAQLDQIENLDRGIERPLEGPGEKANWEAIETHNRALAEAVEAEHGDVHGENAHAFADFMGNHYLKSIEKATGEEVEEFLTEYYPRNAWPTTEQKAVVRESLELLFEQTDVADIDISSE